MRDYTVDYGLVTNRTYVSEHPFAALKTVASYFGQDAESEHQGRELLFHLLDHGVIGDEYGPLVDALYKAAGLYPYIEPGDSMSSSDLLAYEAHRPLGAGEVILHDGQLEAYLTLMSGRNVVLSAPTSFGKSLLIDVMIMSGRYKDVVVIVPTVALIDETRRRLVKKFGTTYKIITHPPQDRGERNVYVLTQERYLELPEDVAVDFFVIDEFYKLRTCEGREYAPRMISLNKAFLRLLRKQVQFLLIGPNIECVTKADDEDDVKFEFIKTRFKTVGSDLTRCEVKDDKRATCLEICKTCVEPTLIFCKSVPSLMDLASYLLENGLSVGTSKTRELADWVAGAYSEQWKIVPCLRAGIVMHYGALPRSLSQYLLHLFNGGEARFLLCTSTLIEGVNTSAKNIIVYDNKIAQRKFDYFTFNNIRGRAGRMFRHHVGHVYILNDAPQLELPLVEIPAVTLPNNIPSTLAFDAYETRPSGLSEAEQKRQRYLHAQKWLPVSVIKENGSIDPMRQVELAKKLQTHPESYYGILSWSGFPRRGQLKPLCEILKAELMGDDEFDHEVSSAAQMAFKIVQMGECMQKGLKAYFEEVRRSDRNNPTIDVAIGNALSFLRNWAEYKIPMYIQALNRIQRHSFEMCGLIPGDYSEYAARIKHWFRPPAETILEEYGLPMQITDKIGRRTRLPEMIDELVPFMTRVDPANFSFEKVERDLFDFAFAR